MIVEIRPASMDDYHAICGLMRQIDDQHRAAYPELFKSVEPPRSRAYVQEWVNSDSRHIWLAVQGEEPAGLIQFAIQAAGSFPLLVPRIFINIDTLVVDEALQRQGIGHALMEAVHDWGHQRGIDQFELGVFAFNEAAQALYASMGYEIKYLRLWRKK